MRRTAPFGDWLGFLASPRGRPKADYEAILLPPITGLRPAAGYAPAIKNRLASRLSTSLMGASWQSALGRGREAGIKIRVDFAWDFG